MLVDRRHDDERLQVGTKLQRENPVDEDDRETEQAREVLEALEQIVRLATERQRNTGERRRELVIPALLELTGGLQGGGEFGIDVGENGHRALSILAANRTGLTGAIDLRDLVQPDEPAAWGGDDRIGEATLAAGLPAGVADDDVDLLFVDGDLERGDVLGFQGECGSTDFDFRGRAILTNCTPIAIHTVGAAGTSNALKTTDIGRNSNLGIHQFIDVR